MTDWKAWKSHLIACADCTAGDECADGRSLLGDNEPEYAPWFHSPIPPSPSSSGDAIGNATEPPRGETERPSCICVWRMTVRPECAVHGHSAPDASDAPEGDDIRDEEWSESDTENLRTWERGAKFPAQADFFRRAYQHIRRLHADLAAMREERDGWRTRVAEWDEKLQMAAAQRDRASAQRDDYLQLLREANSRRDEQSSTIASLTAEMRKALEGIIALHARLAHKDDCGCLPSQMARIARTALQRPTESSSGSPP